MSTETEIERLGFLNWCASVSVKDRPASTVFLFRATRNSAAKAAKKESDKMLTNE